MFDAESYGPPCVEEQAPGKTIVKSVVQTHFKDVSSELLSEMGKVVLQKRLKERRLARQQKQIDGTTVDTCHL